MELLRNHKYINDLGMVELEVCQHCAKLESAMQKCEGCDITNESLEELLKAVIDFGGGKIAWKARLQMNGKGMLHAMGKGKWWCDQTQFRDCSLLWILQVVIDSYDA